MTGTQWIGLIVALVFTAIILLMIGAMVFGDDDQKQADADEAPILVTVTTAPSLALSPTPFPATAIPTSSGALVAQAPATNQVVPTAAVPLAATAANCTVRSDLPIYTVQAGDTLGSLAEFAGITVEELAAYNCILNEDQLLEGQTLYIPNLPTVPTVAANTTSLTACELEWFFVFDTGQGDLLNACPSFVISVNAIGQNFQNGRIYVYPAPPLTPDARGIAYVIYNDGTWEAYQDTWDDTQNSEDPSLIPPAGLFQPTAAIGKVWRANPLLQEKIGWAIEAPVAFIGRAQLPSVASDYFYIDHGVQGYVLRLTTTATAPNTWQLIGSYVPAA